MRWQAADPEPSAGPAATRRAGRSPGREAHQRSSRPARRPCHGRDPALTAGAEADRRAERDRPGMLATALGRRFGPPYLLLRDARPVLDHLSCGPPLKADRPRELAFQICPAGQLSLRRAAPGPTPHLIECCRIHRGARGACRVKTADAHSERCCGIPASRARTSVSR